jgi:hypothetical protein
LETKRRRFPVAVLSNFAKKTYDKNKGISPETNESFP